LQSDAERLRRSFLKGYAVIISMTIPVAITFALFAEEIVRIVLGPKWNGAAVVLRLLAPRALVSALVNPLGWFLMATGQVGRSLNIALLIAPVVIIGVVAGLRHGPAGVALGYSTAMLVLVVPIIAWAKHGTGMATRDFWNAIKRPLAAGAMAGATGWLTKFACKNALTPIPLLILGLTLSLGVYVCILLAGVGQMRLYADLVNQMSLRRRPGPTES